MDRQKVAKEAIAHYNKMHANPSSEAKNFYIGGWLDGVQELYSLVKRMREAQIEKDESDQGYRAIPHICILEKKDRLESDVDEYLKKMEE